MHMLKYNVALRKILENDLESLALVPREKREKAIEVYDELRIEAIDKIGPSMSQEKKR